MAQAIRARAVKSAGVVMLFASLAAWAGGEARAHKPKSTAATQASLAQARQKLEQQQAQVKKLQDAVARQESGSKQASERLQQQDQAIGQMQQQLQALQAKQAAGHR